MKILIVQTSYLGDTVLSTPVIAGVRRLHPEARIWIMTTPAAASLVARDPLLEGVIPFAKRGPDAGGGGLWRMARRLRGMSFERVYSLHRSLRTALLLAMSGIPHRTGFADAHGSIVYHQRARRRPEDHDVLRNLSLLSGEIPLEALDPELRLFAPGRAELTAALQAQLPPAGGYAVLVPGSAWKTKMWHWEHFREVGAYLRGRGLPVVLLGGPGDRAVNQEVARGLTALDLAGETSVAEAMTVVREAALVVCNDSLALHLASAFKVPCVAVFCATSPAFGFGPWRNRALVVERDDLPCKPCARHGGRSCPTGTNACMQGLPATRVIAAIETLVGS
jgi:heptosyltransferase-2